MAERKQYTSEMIIDGHLGGCLMTGDGATYYPVMWQEMIKKYDIKTMIDVGCGAGFALDFFKDEDVNVHGVEGCKEIIERNLVSSDLITQHDYENDGVYIPKENYDFCWSCEFVEHVDANKINNFIETFKKAKIVAITYAEPGQGGHHHVNEQTKDYWVKIFKDAGFSLLEEDTSFFRSMAQQDREKHSPSYESHFIKRGLIFENKKKKVAFWCGGGHLGERGTEVYLYDYAHYNEKILGNESFIFHVKEHFYNHDGAIKKFYDRFQGNVYCIDSFLDMDDILLDNDISFLYNLKAGLNDGLSKVAKNCVHCVFETFEPHGEVYASIAPWVHGNENGYHPVVPPMVSLPPIPADINLRTELNIPQTATVFGGYGGRDRFDIEFVHDAVIQVAKQNPNIFFLFANFFEFYHEKNEPLPNIIHLPCIIDLDKKVEFINTCDAMLWARSDGEVVSMAMGEFSTLNKPIICKNIGYSGHVHLLKDKAIWYEEKDDLIDILENFDKDEMAKRDWNAYKEYTPEKVMKIFDEVFLDGKNNEETHSPPRSKRKIIDTFIFYNELTMLQFRLKELNDHVDYFVIVEATKTHAGHSKPLFFKENIDRFHAYKDKIIHVVVDDFPASAKEVMAAIDTDKINTHYDAKRPVTSPAWKNENHQRRAGIRRGLEKLKDVLNDEDIILISDADEIPKVDTLDALRQNGLPSDDNLCHLLQNMYYYNLKYKTTRTELGIVDGHWAFAKAIYYSVFVNRHNSDAQEIRMTYVCNGDGTCGFDGPAEKHDPHMIGEHIHDAGWHFSYFGNVQFIKNKLKNFAHQEYNNEEVLDDDRLYDCIEKGNDLFGRVGRDSLIIIKIEDNIENLPHNYKMLL